MKTKTKKVVKTPVYTAKIKLLGRFYTSKGKSVVEALTNLKPEGVARGSSVLVLTKGDEVRERILPGVQTFRLFSGGRITREVALKNVSILFDNL